MTSLAPTYRIAIFAAFALCATAYVPRVAAIVVVASDGQDHTIAPTDNPGWANVADRGVYLGDRWMITAGHVGAGPTTFAGIGTFGVEGAGVPLTNPDGMDPTSDLVLYRLAADPGLPSLTIGGSTPAAGASVLLIGSGLGLVTDNLTSSESHWTRTGTAPNYTYTSVPSGGDWHGFSSSGAAKLWGTNLVEANDRPAPQDAYPSDPNYGETMSFLTRFNKVGYNMVTDPLLVTNSEAQAQSNDSGSAVFHKLGTDWTLAGITFAVGIEDNQPGGTATALYGNYTVIGDLAFYRNQILSITAVPEVGSLALAGAASALAACGLALRNSRRSRLRTLGERE